MKVKTLNRNNILQLEKAAKGVYVVPSKTTKSQDDHTRDLIKQLKYKNKS